MPRFKSILIVLTLIVFGLVYVNLPSAQAIVDAEQRIAVTEEGEFQRFSVLKLNPRQDQLPEFDLNLNFENRQAFSQTDAPSAVLYDFKSAGERGNIELLNPAGNYPSGAAAWLSDPPALTDLAENASNTLAFAVNIPDGQAPGAYTAAVVFEDSAGQRLGHHLIIINVGFPEDTNLVYSSLDLADNLHSIDLDEARVDVGLINDSLWHIDPSAELRLSNTAGETRSLFLTQAEGHLGILPKNQQVYSLPEADKAELKRLLSDGWQGEVKIFCAPGVECLGLTPLEDIENETTSQPPAQTAPTDNQPAGENKEGAAAGESGSGFSWNTILGYAFPIILAAGLIATLIFTLRLLKIWHDKRSAFDPKAEIKPLTDDDKAPEGPPPPVFTAPTAKPKAGRAAKPPVQPGGPVIPDLPSVDDLSEF